MTLQALNPTPSSRTSSRSPALLFALLSLRLPYRLKPRILALSVQSLWVGGAFLVLGPLAHGQTQDEAAQRAIEQQRRAAEREAQQRAVQERRPDVYLQEPAGKEPGAASPDPAAKALLIPESETPCFPIKSVKIEIRGEAVGTGEFGWLQEKIDGSDALGASDMPVGRCLGARGVQVVADRLQNALIGKGYTTTRVVVPAQNLQDGTLLLTVIPGRISGIRWAPTPRGASHRASRWNTVAFSEGDILNLRDIEQSLENFKRVPTAEADIQIEPGAEPGSSNVVISHSQPFPFRLTLSGDDSGTSSTGKYQGSTTLSYDNWWTLSDLFYITFNNDLGGTDTGERGTQGRSVHYSVPFGYWTLGTTWSQSAYRQTVAGANQDYLYAGKSRNAEVKLSRIMHRDAQSKTNASIKAFVRSSSNFIDDTEVEVQRRQVGGWELGLGHKRTSAAGTQLEANLAYKRGTGAFGSLVAPEEAFGEGTSRMRIFTADATLTQPFKVMSADVTYTANWRAQFDRSALTSQDRFAIGGRYTVRGFDGLNSLSAERGWVLRNEVSTPVPGSVALYAGLDHGQVGGTTSEQLVGTRLTGAVVGVRGQLSKLQFDLFVGTPVKRPANFTTAHTTYGFSLNASF